MLSEIVPKADSDTPHHGPPPRDVASLHCENQHCPQPQDLLPAPLRSRSRQTRQDGVAISVAAARFVGHRVLVSPLKDGQRRAPRLDPGFSTSEVCRRLGLNYSQLDNWTVRGIVHASVTPARGSGSKRSYSLEDVGRVRLVLRLLREGGVPLQRIRAAFEEIEGRGLSLRDVTLKAKGPKRKTIYAVDARGNVIELGSLRGQGVFSEIAFGEVFEDAEAEVRVLQHEPGSPERELSEDEERAG